MSKKTLLIIPGLPRTGSTFIFNTLLQHDEVFNSKVKEPGLFHRKDIRLNVLSKNEYFENYNNFLDKKVFIDATVTYFHDLNCIKKAIDFSSANGLDLKFLLLNRQKYQRAKSQYFHEIFRSEILENTVKSFSDLIQKEYNDINENILPKTSFFASSDYENMLEEIKRIYPSSKILQLNFDEKYNQKAFSKILNFLELKHYEFNFDKVHKNESIVTNSKLLIYIKNMIKRLRLKSPMIFESFIFRKSYNLFHKLLLIFASNNNEKFNKNEEKLFFKLYRSLHERNSYEQ